MSRPSCCRSICLILLITRRFPTCAITKQALVIPNPVIRGHPVSITVPKRFFQKTAEIPPRDAVEAGPSAYSRYTSNPNNREVRDRASSIQEASDVTSLTTAMEKASYSPQDARSDLPKNKKGKQTQQVQLTAGSPEVRKVKPKKQRQELTTKEEPALYAATAKTDDLTDSAKVDEHVSVSMTVEPTVCTVSDETTQPQVNEKTSTILAKEEVVEPAGTEAIASEPDTVDSIPKTASSKIPPAIPAPSEEPTVGQVMVCHNIFHTDLSFCASTLTEYTDFPAPDEDDNSDEGPSDSFYSTWSARPSLRR